jgi:hypothetical protein
MDAEKYIVVKQDVIKTESGEILTVVEPSDIMIVEFHDGFFNVQKPIFASELEEYHTPLELLKRNPDGFYESFKVERMV